MDYIYRLTNRTVEYKYRVKLGFFSFIIHKERDIIQQIVIF